MKNVSTLHQNNTQSPKTPGGISKSLLIPCRRVGLSRKWKNSGPSPFISPLAASGEANEDKVETRKRKEPVTDENCTKTFDSSTKDVTSKTVEKEIADINNTPSRSVDLPRKKKSKTLLSSINKPEQSSSDLQENVCNSVEESIKLNTQKAEDEVISTPVRSKSKRLNSPKSSLNAPAEINNTECIELKENYTASEQIQQNTNTHKKSPNNLKKECIVVIQKKAFKNIVKIGNSADGKCKKENITSQTIFDSDSDDTPLSHIINNTDLLIDNEDHFTEQTNKLREKKDIKSSNITKKPKIEKTKAIVHKSSQSSFDDDDDFDDKKTILIRKTYEKVIKPQKAKSTGSITQKDIDELKTRIEAKKKLLLAKSLGPETAELRGLIKKWQKGCQDALMELLDLMKSKFPDQNMGYSEMLSTLKIPASLVGYDSDNDCFNSPDDENIILKQFNDL